MSAGAPWTSNHPRRVIFWRRGSCCSWIPAVLEQWHWNQASDSLPEEVSFEPQEADAAHPEADILVSSSSLFRRARGVPCLFVPHMWSTPSANSRTHARGPHSASTGTAHWGYSYLKPYKHKFVDRITIIIEQYALGRGHETHEPFYLEHNE